MRQIALLLASALHLACAMGDKPVGRDGSLVDLYPHFQDYYPFSSEPDTSLISQPCVQCDDSNPCTKDTCLADGGCENEPEPQGTPCDDKNACTVNERCNATGQCASNPSESTDAVYRYFNGSTGAYYYSRSDKGGPSGYTLERVVFRIRRQGEPHTVPLYRLGSASAAEFMLSVNPTEASACCGYQQNGVIGGIFPKKQPGAVELHRLVKKVPKLRHVSTLDPQEATTDGYTYQFMQGYVCPPD